MCTEEGECRKLFCLGEGANVFSWGKEGFIYETGVKGKIHRLTIKLTPSKKVFKDFPKTLKGAPTECLPQKNAYF